MYFYHGKPKNLERLEARICRCDSNGAVYDLKQMVSAGRVLNPVSGTPLSTLPVAKKRDESPPEGRIDYFRFIFAVGLDYKVHVAPDGDRPTVGSVKHETLFHNADVLAAGEIWIEDGVVRWINDFSGSYVTDGELEGNPGFSAAVLKAFALNELPVADGLRTHLIQMGSH